MTNAVLKDTIIKNSYFKNSKLDGVVMNDSDNDSCFKQDIINRIFCKINFEINPDRPPYETDFELRDSYSLRS